MTGLGRRNATPFAVEVAPRVCECKLTGRDLGSFKRPARAIQEIEGYWNVYIGFFGSQTMWLDFTVTDIRDGKVIWKNGRKLTEEDYGSANEDDTGTGGRGRRVRPGQWIGNRLPSDW